AEGEDEGRGFQVPRHGRGEGWLRDDGRVVFAEEPREEPACAARERNRRHERKHVRARRIPGDLGARTWKGTGVLYVDGASRGSMDEPRVPEHSARRNVVGVR